MKLLKESVSFPKNDMYVVSLESQLQTRSTFTVSRSSALQHPGGTRLGPSSMMSVQDGINQKIE